MFKEKSESLKDKKIKLFSKNEIIDKSISYFYERDENIYLPSKSFSVAIIYSRLLADEFGGSMYDYLDMEDLFEYNQDMFTYSQHKDIYDPIIEKVTYTFDLDLGWVPETVKYFKEEMLAEYSFADIQ